ncbi:hypothetical protein [Dyella kyungheensis]|uniref:Uncharacterized protein n=1 Tax=Dyella kyungheensis TaxID=1242174 RepID=A0ABS2JVP3_9GAMM|nr:hypothetical protein [Dyella kyungheensis]MBM7123092.1 hypothetical protein [Dyella kyungheensis]
MPSAPKKREETVDDAASCNNALLGAEQLFAQHGVDPGHARGRTEFDHVRDQHGKNEHQGRPDHFGELLVAALTQLPLRIDRHGHGVTKGPPERPRIEHQPAHHFVQEFFERLQDAHEVHRFSPANGGQRGSGPRD